jgi:hypothetical protein
MRRAGTLLTLAATLAACAGVASSPSAEPIASAAASTTPSAAEATSSVVATDVAEATHEPAEEIDAVLRDELLAMMAEDQAVRTGIAPAGDDRTPDELFAAMADTDARHRLRMEEILDEHGWPGWSLVGEEAATAAWVLIQHADVDLDLQRRGLGMLAAAVEANDASAGDLAYLTDRVRVAEGLPQVYGTQLQVNAEGEIEPRTPIADPATLDDRRQDAGLATWDEYVEEFRRSLEEWAEPSQSPGA